MGRGGATAMKPEGAVLSITYRQRLIDLRLHKDPAPDSTPMP